MKVDYKEKNANDGGIYVIKNTNNGRRYYGSTSLFKKRYMEHKKRLLGQKHGNQYLQADFNLHAPSDFLFEVLEVENDKLTRITK